MAFLLVVVSIALVVCLGLLIFGRGQPAARVSAPGLPAAASTTAGRSGPDPELEKRRREVDELKATVAELRGELKQTRKKLHDQRAGGQGRHGPGQGPDRGRAERVPAARGGAERAGRRARRGGPAPERERGLPHPTARRPAPAPVAAPAAAPAAAPLPPAPEARRFRELSDTDREKMDRLEHLANRERSRAQELSAEVRRLKGRTETQARVYTVVKGELDLLKDKFKALEKRLNRTLLERDLLRRAIRDLEKKSGLAADRTELTADEVAASDRSVEDRAAAEAAEIARRTRPPEPDVPAPAASAEPAVSGAAVEPAALGRRTGPAARLCRAAHGEGRLTATFTPGRPPRVSLATRIFLGHAVVLVTFGLLILFSVSELHRNQQEIRLVSQGYLLLAQDAAALDSFQRNQAQEAAQIAAEADPQTRAALARLAPLTFPPLLRARLGSLEATLASMRTTAPPSERSFLDSVQTRVEHVATDVEALEATASRAWSGSAGPESHRRADHRPGWAVARAPGAPGRARRSDPHRGGRGRAPRAEPGGAAHRSVGGGDRRGAPGDGHLRPEPPPGPDPHRGRGADPPGRLHRPAQPPRGRRDLPARPGVRRDERGARGARAGPGAAAAGAPPRRAAGGGGPRLGPGGPRGEKPAQLHRAERGDAPGRARPGPLHHAG